jgi:glucose-6-phosphate 1-dehydrogenase
VITRLAVFGATGDLTARYLLPALAALRAGGHIDDGFELVGTGRDVWDDNEFQRRVRAHLERHAADVPVDARAALVRASRYRPSDLGDPESVAAVIAGHGPIVAYFALPPAVAPTAVRALHAAGLPSGSTVVFEKPFGEDLDGAVELNRLLASIVDEQHVFRVDHFLAMTTVQNVLGTRLANRILDPIWNSTHIEAIDIVWDETLALEGRAGYYDHVGALEDMLQNHLLQLLCLVAMEPPVRLDERNLRDHKLAVLRAVRPLTADDVVRHTRRARYAAGRVGDRAIRAYVDEDGVDPEHGTETFAEVALHIDNQRWSGTTFRLRTGKAMRRNRKEVVVRFRDVPHLPFGPDHKPSPNVLRFGLEPEGLTLELFGIGPSAPPMVLAPITLSAQLEPSELPAYGRLLLDILKGETLLSIRGDEAEEAWRVLTPVIDGWANDLVPITDYPAGSEDPPHHS